MSYCRFGEDSDVYVYPSIRDDVDVIVCYRCCLSLDSDSVFHGPEAALGHLRMHQMMGDEVPDHAIERLQKEIEEQQR